MPRQIRVGSRVRLKEPFAAEVVLGPTIVPKGTQGVVASDTPAKDRADETSVVVNFGGNGIDSVAFVLVPSHLLLA